MATISLRNIFFLFLIFGWSYQKNTHKKPAIILNNSLSLFRIWKKAYTNVCVLT